MDLKYECCFCGETVDINLPESLVIYLSSGPDWKNGTENSLNQQLWCHRQCLKEKMKAGIALTFDDDE
jgi:hypothetical protein